MAVRDIAQQVRAIYEKRPYPTPHHRSLGRTGQRLPPFEWIRATCAIRDPFPRRILVAGCGTGMEAFALQRRFPDAEITAIDFSRRSIALARALQKRLVGRVSIQFRVGDLSDAEVMRSLNCEFDFISCHGVASYIPRPRQMLRNLKHGLGEGGALYLGANGASHFSTKSRPALRVLGFELNELPAQKRLRCILRVCDALGAGDDVSKGKLPLNLLETDLFGPLIHNLPLRRWVAICRNAGLSFSGHYYGFGKLRAAINEGLLDPLMPWSRSRIYMLIDLLDPCGFHQMIFTKRPVLSPSWRKESTLKLRPVVTRLYRFVSRERGKLLRLGSAPINTVVEIDSANWEYYFLNRSDGKQTVAQILQELPERPRWDQLCRRLYLFYQLAVINFEKV